MTRSRKGDKEIASNQNQWELFDTADSIEVPETELDQLSRDMLRAVKRAEQQPVKPAQRNRPALPFRFAAATTLIAVCIVMVCLLVIGDQRELVAASLEDIQGIVVDQATGKPIPGVKIKFAVKFENSKSYTPPRYIGSTDLTGLFRIPREADAPAGICSFYIDDEEVAQFEIDTAAYAVDTGFVSITVGRLDQQPARLSSYPVDVAPGTHYPVGKLISVDLDQDSPTNWSGTFINDLGWPVAFNLAHVVGGIYRLEGPDHGGLRLTVKVAGEELISHSAGSDKITLIAYDEKYSQQADLAAECHHGWYDAVIPPAGVAVEPIQREITLQDGDYSVSWPAVPGISYALILSPPSDGVFSPCFVPTIADGQTTWHKWIYLGDLLQPQMSLYDLDYLPNDGSPASPINTLPKYPFFKLQMNAAHEYRNQPGLRPQFIFLDDTGPVDGKFILKRSTFLLTDAESYSPLILNYPDPGAGYAIQVTEQPIGKKTKLQITGDMRAAKQINWDIDEDYVTDKTGESIEILVPYACAFSVTATVVTSDARYVVSIPLDYHDEKIIGFKNGTNGPVIKGVPAPPAKRSRFITMTYNMRPGRVCYGYSASASLGPVLLVTPPDDWRSRKLATLQIHLFGSPMAGECDAIYLSPDLHRLKDVTGAMPDITSSRSFIDGKSSFIDAGYNNLSVDVDRALSAVSEGISFKDFFAARDLDIYKRTAFNVGMGLDVNNLQDDSEVKRILTEFKESERYARRYLTEDDQELIWYVDLHDMVLSGKEGLLINICTETQGLLNEAQWELYSGGDYPARVELIDESGETWTTYYDLEMLK